MVSEFVSRSFQRSVLFWLNALFADRDYSLFDLCFPATIHEIMGLVFCTNTKAEPGPLISAISDSSISVYHELLRYQVDLLVSDVIEFTMAFEFGASEHALRLRLSTIIRSLNLERLVLYNDEAQLLLVLELVFLMTVRVAKNEKAVKTLEGLSSHHIEAISIYLDSTGKASDERDFAELQAEAQRRETNCQLAFMSMELEKVQESYRGLVEDLESENAQLRNLVEQSSKKLSQVDVLKWDLSLVAKAASP